MIRSEIPEGMTLTKRANRILEKFEEYGRISFANDSSDFETLQQLMEISGGCGYIFLKRGQLGHEGYSYDCVEKDNIGEGQYLLIDVGNVPLV